MALPDYYRVLHVQRDAPLAIIKASYRTLRAAIIYHPDRDNLATLTQLLNEAYAVLSDSAQRFHYDQKLFSEENHEQTTKSLSAVQCCRFCHQLHGYNAIDDQDINCPHCHKPLFAPWRENIAQVYRHIVRIKREAPIKYQLFSMGTVFNATLKDISPKGLSFISPAKLTARQPIHVELANLDAEGYVVYCRVNDANAGYLVGVKLTRLDFIGSYGNFLELKI